MCYHYNAHSYRINLLESGAMLKILAVAACSALTLSLLGVAFRVLRGSVLQHRESVKTDKSFNFKLILSTAGLYIIGYIVVLAIYPGTWSLETFFEIMERWDVKNYASVASQGYVSEGEQRFAIAFLPLTSWFAGFIATLTGISSIAALLVISITSGLLLTVAFYRLVRQDFSHDVAVYAVVLLWAWPGAFYRLVPYSESLFTLLVTLLLLALRQGKWKYVALLAFGVGLTRTQGYAVLPAIVAEIVSARKTSPFREFWSGKLLAVAAIPAAIGVYMLLNWKTYGHPFQFIEFQKNVWSREFASYWHGIWNLFVYYPFNGWQDLLTRNWSEIAAMMVMTFYTLIATCLLRPSYAAFLAASVFFFASNSFQISNVRFASTLAPLFIVIAATAPIGKYKRALPAVVGFCLFFIYFHWWTLGIWVAG